MATINGVDIGNVVKDAMGAAKLAADGDWNEIKEIVKNIADTMLVDLKYIAKEKANNRIDEYGAKIFLEDQRMVARVRIRSLAIMTLQSAERIINAIIKVFREAANTALGWDIF